MKEIKGIRTVLSILEGYLAQYLKSLMAVRGDFFGWLIASVTYEATLLSFILILFYNAPEIAGWTIYEIMLLRGLFCITDGFYFNIFNGFIYDFSERYIINGELDRVLIRPFNPYFQIMGENLGVHEFIETTIGIVYVGIALVNLKMSFTFNTLLVILLSTFSGLTILGGITTIIVSLQFFIRSRGSIVEVFNNFTDFAVYPISIYHKALRFVLTFVVPFGFIAYFPASSILQKKEAISHYLVATPIIGILFFWVGYMSFSLAIKHYHGTGT